MDKTSAFYKILKLGEEKGWKGITPSEFNEWLKEEQSIEAYQSPVWYNAQTIFDDCFEKSKQYRPNEEQLYIIKTEHLFRLLELEELELAKRNAEDSMRSSRVAIFIAVLSLASSLAFGAYQIYNPIKLDESQLQSLIESNLKVSKAIEDGIKVYSKPK